MYEIFNRTENLKFKFIIHISQSNFNEELKSSLLSKFLYNINNIQIGKTNLKEFNYIFNNNTTTRNEDLCFYGTKFIIEDEHEELNKFDLKKIFETKK